MNLELHTFREQTGHIKSVAQPFLDVHRSIIKLTTNFVRKVKWYNGLEHGKPTQRSGFESVPEQLLFSF